ncbi:MAG: 2-oxoacid:acceptor oxidoreductase family protein, partial [Chloroflexi bacterium]|nr:2-oxoacid:acceptor oxidoreductase family protein [Chloroflexota bacterium]
VVLLNTQRVVPVMVLLGSSVYPNQEEIVAKLEKNSARVVPIDAVKIARAAGSTTSANMVMLGAAFGSGLLPLAIGLAKAELEARFSGEARRANIRALELGCQAYRES